MLKRNDLVKQFELVVKQEIINHNDAVLNTNQSINKINQEIESFKTKLNKYEYIQKENVVSVGKIINEECSLADNICRERYHILDNRLNKLSNEISNIESEVLKISKEFVSEKSLKLRQMNVLNDWINSTEKSFDNQKVDSAFKLQQLERTYRDVFEKYKKEIETKPSDIEEFKKQISKKLEDQKNDNEGILKELRLYKKQVFIQEKEIEYLLTRYNRIGI